MNDAQIRTKGANAYEPLRDAMLATRAYDVDAFERALADAEQPLHPQHTARDMTAKARQYAVKGHWYAAYVAVWRAMCGLVFTSAPSQIVLPASPAIADCACGTIPFSGAKFCTECGRAVLERESEPLDVARPDDADLTTDMEITVRRAAVHGTALIVLYAQEGTGISDGCITRNQVGQFTIDLGDQPAAVQALDQAQARLSEWSAAGTVATFVDAPGRLARLIAPDGTAVTIPPSSGGAASGALSGKEQT